MKSIYNTKLHFFCLWNLASHASVCARSMVNAGQRSSPKINTHYHHRHRHRRYHHQYHGFLCRHLIELLPAENGFSRLVASSDLAVYFNEAEMAEMAVEDIDSEHLYLQDLGMDIATAATSYPSTRGLSTPFPVVMVMGARFPGSLQVLLSPWKLIFQ